MRTYQIKDEDLDLDDPQAELKAQMRALDAEAKEMWWDDAWRRERIQDAATLIYQGFKHESLIDYMADVERVGKGEPITVEEVAGLEVFHTTVGGRIRESSLTERIWALPQDYLGFHLVELEEKMESGFSRKMAQVKDFAIQQLDAGVNRRFIKAIQAAIPSTSPFYGEAAGLSLPMLNTMISEVKDENGAEGVTIFGRATMTDQIVFELMGQNGFTPQTNEELLRKGVLGTYLGCPIVTLKNYRDRYDRAFIPGNELFVAAQGATKVGLWGGLFAQDWDQPGGWYWHSHGRLTFGMAVRKRRWMRRLVDTNRLPG